jgi:hypothetical protein
LRPFAGGAVARLAQTSIRFTRYEISEAQFTQLTVEIDAAAARIAREIYGPAVEVDVVVEAGSLLVRITVIGGLLLGTYDAISKYPDFKEGVAALVEDAEKYGSAIVDEILKVTGQKKPDSVSKRDMTPGRISRVIEKLEKVRELERRAPKGAVHKEQLRQIARDVQAIGRDLEPQELKKIDEGLESSGLPPLGKLPKPEVLEEPRAVLKEREKFKRPPALWRRKLRHHRRFVVGEGRPRSPTR